jgi:tetratricopeptide (TPR) repeat protein
MDPNSTNGVFMVPEGMSIDEVIDIYRDHALLHLEEFRKTNDAAMLQAAQAKAERAVQTAQIFNTLTHHIDALRTHHTIMLEWVTVTKHPLDMAQAVLRVNGIIDCLPDDEPYVTEAVNFMIRISNILLREAGRLGELESNNELQQQTKQAEALYVAAHVYISQYDAEEKSEDLVQACILLRHVMSIAPAEADQLLTWATKLGYYLQRAYEYNHNADLLAESIAVCEHSLGVAVHVNPEDKASLLETWAESLQMQAKLNGSIEDLSLAISLSMKALEATTSHDCKVQYINNLASRLEDRFDRIRRVEDLREAISINISAFEHKPGGYPLAVTRHNIGAKLLKLSASDGDGRGTHYEQAFMLLSQAVVSVPDSMPVPALWLQSLSLAYRQRYRQRGDHDDLDLAIQHQEKAVAMLPKVHPEWPEYAHHMACLLRERAELTRDRRDLDRSIAVAKDAVLLVPEKHVLKAGITFTFARLYELAHTFDHGMMEIVVDGKRSKPFWEDQAVECYFEAMQDSLGNHKQRVAAAASLMGIFQRRGEHSRGVEVGSQMLDLLHKTNTRLLKRKDHQRIMSDFSDFAVETCTASLDAGEDPARALRYLELGRGAILGLLIDERDDVSELMEVYPEQGGRFQHLRNDFSQPSVLPEDAALREEFIARRDEQVRELDKLIREIRQLPRMEGFFRGPSAAKLEERATDGPIIVVYVADSRSDAILVTVTGVQTLPLPALSKTDIRDWITRDPTRFKRRREQGIKNKLCREYLKWLWDVCVEPVLSHLDLIKKPSRKDVPRVWWIGAGLASSLPFHAAGDHSPGCQANAYFHIISSYIPTIRALGYAWRRAAALRKLSTKESEILVALMPTTPDVNGIAVKSLEKVTEELAVIRSALGPTYTLHTSTQPSREDILDRISRCDLVHFACHGVSIPQDPSSSFLILQRAGDNPTSPPVADRLSVQDVSNTTLGRARIAYLSACSTAENMTKKLADEVIHLASGFQVAGFPHVVAALWPADDKVSVSIAEGFYKGIAAKVKVEDRDVAWALRQAVMKVRERYPLQPLLWAQYVHIGV